MSIVVDKAQYKQTAPSHSPRAVYFASPSLFHCRIIRSAYTFQKLDKLCEFGLYPPPQSS
jgi:hypothetical protein